MFCHNIFIFHLSIQSSRYLQVIIQQKVYIILYTIISLLPRRVPVQTVVSHSSIQYLNAPYHSKDNAYLNTISCVRRIRQWCIYFCVIFFFMFFFLSLVTLKTAAVAVA